LYETVLISEHKQWHLVISEISFLSFDISEQLLYSSHESGFASHTHTHTSGHRGQRCVGDLVGGSGEPVTTVADVSVINTEHIH